jgi:hypothetical protein
MHGVTAVDLLHKKHSTTGGQLALQYITRWQGRFSFGNRQGEGY